MSFFPAAFELVVGIEGGYTADPRDPGGETKYGISKRSYPNLVIAQLTLEDAQAIYLQDFWTPAGCDLLPWERALCLFDTAVNQGLSAAHTLNSQAHDTAELMASRAVRYAENEHFPTYGRGWMNRLFKVFKSAQVTPQ